MFDHRKLLSASMKKRRVQLSATQIIAIGFAALIVLGACLLTLPAASRSGESCGFFPALFTATSATCVTGLVLFDTYTQWSAFGQVVIITLIEIGGLGFMSAASTFVFLLRRKVGLRQRMVIAQALNLNDMDGVMRIQKLVLTGSITVQGIGALICASCRSLAPKRPWPGAYSMQFPPSAMRALIFSVSLPPDRA